MRALEEAGLRPARDYLYRYPHELSGGQRQRVCIAGAIVLEPDMIVADEPVASLDVSIRNDILKLMVQHKKELGVTYLFITHDLSLAWVISDRIAVMYLGKIVEIGETEEVVANPQHPYTKALISVIPVPDPTAKREHTILTGETPNPAAIPTGCRFHPRCPEVMDICSQQSPTDVQIRGTHYAACLRLNGHTEPAMHAVVGALWPDEAIDAIHTPRSNCSSAPACASSRRRRASCCCAPAAAKAPPAACSCRAPSSRRRWPPSAAYVLSARGAGRSLAIDAEPGDIFVHNMGGAADVSDALTGVARRATLADQGDFTRVMHQLENQHAVCSLLQPQDVPGELEPLYSYLLVAFETDKYVGGPGISWPFQARHLREMAIALTGQSGAGGRYPVDLAFSPVSPLLLGAEVTDALIETVRRGGVVVEILPCPAAGTTAPAAISAAVALQNAEVLAGLVVVQRSPRHADLLRPAPVGGRPAHRRLSARAPPRPAWRRARRCCWRAATAWPATATGRRATPAWPTPSSAPSTR